MAKIRKQAYTMSLFMECVKDKDIREDADVQRACGQWTSEQINELVVTVLTDGYIPPIFIGEDMNLQKWLIDGLQRSTSLKLYRYGNYRISSAIRNSVIKYRAKRKDENGNIVEENGDIVWEDSEFDIKNKTYDELPCELKKQFDSYQVDTVIFEECTMDKMSELIQVYNNHAPMNATQKAFTYVSRFARNVREILDSEFFTEHSCYTEKEKLRGVTERVVLEAVMCMFHLDSWKKQAKQIGIYLNAHSSAEEFGRLADNVHRLERVITDDVKSVFNSKESFLFLTLFDRFSVLGEADEVFAEFLRAFQNNLRRKKKGGVCFDEIDRGRGTKDKAVIQKKLDFLEEMLREFLRKDSRGGADWVESFLCETVGIAPDRLREDMDFYRESLEDLTNRTVRQGSGLLSRENEPSMLAMVIYSYKEDVDLELWMEDYAKRNKSYCADQRKNYQAMLSDWKRFCRRL